MNTNPGRWKVDLPGMTCKNIFTGTEISFEKRPKGFTWKIKYIPMDLLAKYASMPNAKREIRFSIMDAYEAFLRAYNKDDTKKTA